MAATYGLISTVSLSSTASTVTFLNIPQTFTDLTLKMTARTDYAGPSLAGAFRFNNDGNNNYNDVYAYVSDFGSTVQSSKNGPISFNFAMANAGTSVNSNYWSSNEFYMPNYTLSRWKTWQCDGVQETATNIGLGIMGSGIYKDTAAITRIELFPGGGANWIAGSVFSLYGIKSS